MTVFILIPIVFKFGFAKFFYKISFSKIVELLLFILFYFNLI